VEYIAAPRGVNPSFSIEDVLVKWRAITEGIIDVDGRQRIEQLVLNLEDIQSTDEIRASLA
jgi:hypothetical protein